MYFIFIISVISMCMRLFSLCSKGVLVVVRTGKLFQHHFERFLIRHVSTTLPWPLVHKGRHGGGFIVLFHITVVLVCLCMLHRRLACLIQPVFPICQKIHLFTTCFDKSECIVNFVFTVLKPLLEFGSEGVVTFGKVYRRIPGTYEGNIVTCGLRKGMFFALLIPTCCCTAPIRGQHKAHRFIQRLAINNRLHHGQTSTVPYACGLFQLVHKIHKTVKIQRPIWPKSRMIPRSKQNQIVFSKLVELFVQFAMFFGLVGSLFVDGWEPRRQFSGNNRSVL